MMAELKDLQNKWYRKLKEKGFEDIEDTANPNRPLKEWHSIKAQTKRYKRIQTTTVEYQEQIDNFTNHPSFDEACKFIIKHGNCKFKLENIKSIWSMHTQGHTNRSIARQCGRVKSRVDDVIKKFREWMRYLGRN
jgi:hypothetical protein